MKTINNFNKEQILDIVKSYTSRSLSRKQLANKYNCSAGLIKTILIHNNVKLFSKKDTYKAISNGINNSKRTNLLNNKDKIINLYNEGKNLSEIAEIFGYKSKTEVRKLLINNNVKLRNHSEVYYLSQKEIINQNIKRDKEICDLYKKGYTQESLAKQFNISRTGIQRVVNQANLFSKNRPWIEYIVRDRLKKEIEIPYGIKISDSQSMKYKDKNGHSMGIDILIDEFNLGIEVNDIKSHNSSIGYNNDSLPKPKDYHLNKTIMANKQGIDLIHIFEWEVWDQTKFNILVSIIKNRLGLTKSIGASKCKLKQISSKEANQFLDQNHLQGGCKQSFINYGLYYNNELLFVMTFSKPRKTIGKEESKYELLRMCSKINYNVKYGASRILSHFRRDYPGIIKSFGELTHMNSKCYEKLGFKFIRNSPPGYKWVKCKNGWSKEYIVLTRNQTQKHKLVKQGFDKTKSETQIMEERGFRKIYDCGNKIFILE